jgi:hypothetical protein
VLDEGPDLGSPRVGAALVDGIPAAVLGHAEGMARQEELADRRFEGEEVRAGAGRVDQQNAGAEEHIARGDLLVPAAQQIRHTSVPAGANREDRPERSVAIDVGGSVHRIEDDGVAARPGVGRINERLLHLLGSRERDEAAVVEGLEQDLVGDDVELLLFLARDVR